MPDFSIPYQQVGEDICANSNSQDQYSHKWCSFEAVDSPTFVVEIIYFSIVVAIGIIAIRNYIKVKKYQESNRYKHMFGNAYTWMHYIIYLWLICSLIKLVLQVIVYLVFMEGSSSDQQHNQQPDPQIRSPIVILASVYTEFDLFCGFYINLLQMLVLFLFLKNLIQNLNQSQIVTFRIRNLFAYFLKVLEYVRNFIGVLGLLQPIFFFFVSFSQKCQRIIHFNYYFISSETLLIIILYAWAGVILLFLYKKSLLKIQSKDIRRLRWYSFLFAFTLIARVIINFVFTQFIFKQTSLQSKLYQPNSHCKNTSGKSAGLAIMLVSHHLTIHIIPICIVLYIYRPTLINYEKQSLLDNKSQSQFLQSDITYRSISSNFYKESITQAPKMEDKLPTENIQYSV